MLVVILYYVALFRTKATATRRQNKSYLKWGTLPELIHLYLRPRLMGTHGKVSKKQKCLTKPNLPSRLKLLERRVPIQSISMALLLPLANCTTNVCCIEVWPSQLTGFGYAIAIDVQFFTFDAKSIIALKRTQLILTNDMQFTKGLLWMVSSTQDRRENAQVTCFGTVERV